MITADEARYLAGWAARYGASFQPEGECGFGRPCVGIVKDGEYPAYRDYESVNVAPFMQLIHECPDADPPEGVTDAYHKHDCLAVLGRGPDAIHQLYLWVRHLEEHGIGIAILPRRGDSIHLLFHGVMAARLVKQAGEGRPGEASLVAADQLRRTGPGFEILAPGMDADEPSGSETAAT